MSITNNSSSRSANTKKRTTNKKTVTKKKSVQDLKLRMEVTLIVAFALCVLLFLCNFGIIGLIGNYISYFMFGLFGLFAYIFPIYLFACILYSIANTGNDRLPKKMTAIVILLVFLDLIVDLISGIAKNLDKFSIKEIYFYGITDHKGGGLISGSIDYLLVKLIGKPGTAIVSAIVIIVCIIIFTENSLFGSVKESKKVISERAKEDRLLKQEIFKERDEERKKRLAEKEAKFYEFQSSGDDIDQIDKKESLRQSKELQKKNKEIAKEQKDDDKILRMNQKVSGVTYDTKIEPKTKVTDAESGNMHEITINGFNENTVSFDDEEFVYIVEDELVEKKVQEPIVPVVKSENKPFDYKPIEPVSMPTDNDKAIQKPTASKNQNEGLTVDLSKTKHPEYQFPPIDLLTKNSNTGTGDNRDFINATARKLEETLKIFGVEAKVVSVSQGPTVTRYELEPALGTKVSKIKGLSDDIKLSLATQEIRIEAPVPGKSVVGIEIANEKSQAVLLRDLIDSSEFKGNKSNLTFAVGKDISGRTIVYDIDQFPHLLIAGATGSGKSVCINTLIMSILYKANPDDVKLIMVDPKVVELSVYNDIPHLLIPVVTDAKKASAALNWAVNEMMERYKKFADANVRDLKGYNDAMLDKQKTEGETPFNAKLPRLVIIVDELADLMMVAKGDVEEAICRLAQLARACGIHLVVATQRPSVDVITGLIKANMPSRIAFAVSSNVDSRTILDMGGAEELLGKGDMLFFPKGLKKPVRLQGAFVSDDDVNRVVKFLKENSPVSENGYSEIESKISGSVSASGSSSSGGHEQAEFDEYFMDAARYIIEHNKASIGNLQRMFRIGFNRAARIMDKLAEIGVVSADEGTKARTVLMTMEEFENYIEENGL